MNISDQIEHMENDLAKTEFLIEHPTGETDIGMLRNQAQVQAAIIASLLRLVRIEGYE